MANWYGLHIISKSGAGLPSIPCGGIKKKKKSTCCSTIDGVPVRTIFVGNLPTTTTHRDLAHMFSQYGRIEKVDVVSSPRNEQNDDLKRVKKNVFGFVTFSTTKEASRALDSKKYHLRKKHIFVNVADSWHQPDYQEYLYSSDCDIKSDGENEGDTKADCEEEEEEVEEEYSCPVLKLNDDCLHAIFTYIPMNQRHIIGSVCRRWRSITKSMWSTVRTLDFSKPPLDEDILTLKCLKKYVNVCPNLTSLNLSQDSHLLQSSAIAAVARGCKNLEELRISRIDLHDRSLALLARSCPNLKAFYMEGCSNCYDSEMVALIKKCTQLRKIGIRHGMHLNGKWLKYLSGPLESLSLQMCEFPPSFLIEGILNVKETIKTLSLTYCLNLRCSDLDCITEKVPNLQSLTLAGGFPDFKAHTLSSVSRLTQLIELDLDRNNVVCDEFIQDLLDHCPKLQSINLSGTDERVLTSHGLSLVGKFPELRNIRFCFLTALNDIVLKTLSNRLLNLQHLYIAGCLEVTDEGCCSIVSHCRTLQYLDVSGCPFVTKKTVMAAVEAAQIDNKKHKLTLVIGGSGVQLENDWSSPFVIIDTKSYCLPLMNSDLSEHFLLADIENYGNYPDPLNEIFSVLDELCDLDIYDSEGYEDYDDYDYDFEEDPFDI